MNAAPLLPDLKRAFCEAVLGTDTALAGRIAGNAFNRQVRGRIYRNLALSNRATALRTVYPAVLKLVGKDFLEAAAGAVFLRLQFRSGDLQHYGAAFPAALLETA